MSQYSRDQIEWLLPGIWDEGLVLGRVRDDAPDPDMPKATADPRHSADGITALADMQRAWVLAGLDLRTKRILFLTYAIDQSVRRTAYVLGIDKNIVTPLKEGGITQLMEFLNGREVSCEELTTDTVE